MMRDEALGQFQGMLLRVLVETGRELNYLQGAVLMSAAPVCIPRGISIVPGRFPVVPTLLCLSVFVPLPVYVCCL